MLAALFSCDSTPDMVLEAEVKQDELETRRPTSARSLEAEVKQDELEIRRPTSAPSLEAEACDTCHLVELSFSIVSSVNDSIWAATCDAEHGVPVGSGCGVGVSSASREGADVG